MTVRKVLSIPDSRLRNTAEPVAMFDDSLKVLVQDMVDTLEVLGGAGLAAPQIGESKRVIVIKPKLFDTESPDVSHSSETWVLVNPVLTLTGPTQRWGEACLSVPMGTANVERHETCEVKYHRLDGTENTVSVAWPLAGALQHENDHLNGIIYIDHVGALERSLIMKKIEKMRRRIGHVAEAKRDQEILIRRGVEGLHRHRSKQSGQGKSEKSRSAPAKQHGRVKMEKA